ncbi:MAG: ABC transporter ATP-binding protein [Xanthobacteraceae bacterium]
MVQTAIDGFAGAKALLQVDGVTLQYHTPERRVTATYRVDFDIQPGERLILLGPSGCGKSTLLKAIAGFIKPVEGSIRLNGAPVAGPGPDRMMVFQEFDQLLPWKTVRHNVTYPLRCNGVTSEEANRRAERVIASVNLSGFIDSYPHTLSGGMKQRVAIARAMAMRPQILLMDEPFAALDALTRRKMQEELVALWEAVGFTLIFVTHSIEEAVLIGSRVVVLSAHPGQVCGEINVERFGGPNSDDGEFQDACRRIHDLLFPPATGAA